MKKNLELLTPKAIEHGIGPNGRYLKFSNGMLICYMNIYVAVKYSTQWGTTHLYVVKPEMSFPHSFIDIPSINISNMYGATFLMGQINHSKEALTSFECIRPDKIDSIPNSSFCVVATGRWK